MNIGILGAGQLGRMIALAGYPLGLQFRFLDSSKDSPAGHLADLVNADYSDFKALERFADGLDIITYEFENVPVETARFLEQLLPVYPPPAALEAGQDRLVEKRFFRELGVPTPEFEPVESFDELQNAAERIGVPSVLKTRRLGYDGKGQTIIHNREELAEAWKTLQGVPLLLEGFVPFEREVSILAVRSLSGETAFYPLVENHHSGGMLRLSLAPAPDTDPALQSQAEEFARRILQKLNYVGVLAIEFFQHNGVLLANEMAPRVHNSGHWTIEGSKTSQFENHLRAILDLPLGSTDMVEYSAMINLIGSHPLAKEMLAIPEAHLHLYGKDSRPHRKVGHITICAATPEELTARLFRLRAVAGQQELDDLQL